MMITGFYVRPTLPKFGGSKNTQSTSGFILKPKMSKAQAESMVRFAGTAWLAMHLMPAATPAMASTGSEIVKQVAVSTFGVGGPGFLIISLLLIAMVGWLAGYIAQACGKGQIAGMIHIVSVFSCISIVAGAAMKALGSVAEFLG